MSLESALSTPWTSISFMVFVIIIILVSYFYDFEIFEEAKIK